MKKVLILSINAGHGHNITSEALGEYLDSQGATVKIANALEYVNPLISDAVKHGYLLAVKYSKPLYSKFYRLGEKRGQSPPRISLNRITHKLMSKRLIRLIDDFAPDAIVPTHIFAAQMVTELAKSRSYALKAKTIGIITDFTIHPYWEDTQLDHYVLASELLTNQFRKKGMPVERILPFGIPIHSRFTAGLSKAEACEKLKIENKTTLLLMTGSMGYGNLENVISKLDSLPFDFQMLAVCGNNKRLKKNLSGLMTQKTLYTYGFINNVDLFMDASDCICSKPGGLTSSEALAKKLFMIISNAIPGQEERNAEFLVNNGVAMVASKTFPIDECVYELFMNKARLECDFYTLSKPNAAKDLGDFILK